MKILGQRLSDGSVQVFEAPSPASGPLLLRVATLYSAVSPGTEGGKIAAGRQSLLAKARSRPEAVRQVLDTARALGLRATARKVRARLEGATPLGYSLCGRVIEAGALVRGFSEGDLVACAGGGYANHADEAVIPVNLAVRVPGQVGADSAAFATLGAIAIQGVRLASPSAGECAIVIGLGIIGQLACQILRASGCRVFGTDVSGFAVDLSRKASTADAACLADDLEPAFGEFSRGRGADLVLICAGTAGNAPVETAGRLARKRGRVVVVGAVGMHIPREDYYRKEISFTVSCSYGPGRYDPTYEEGGLDYPLPFVRWTEQRNMEAVLDLMAGGAVDPTPLVTDRIPFEEAPSLYQALADRQRPFCGILLEYPENAVARKPLVELAGPARPGRASGSTGIGFLGQGSFAQSFLLPALGGMAGVRLVSICTRSGLSAADAGARHGFARAVDSLDGLLADREVDALVIAARHDMHGAAALAALSSGRPVFVEKPLSIDRDGLASIARLVQARPLPVLQVGYNRRFSRCARAARRHFEGTGAPVCISCRINAGRIPMDSWIQDPVQGGGRILGEACHFVDLMQYLTDAEPVRVFAAASRSADSSVPREDDLMATIEFSDGSVGQLAYLSRGDRSLPKERVEVFGSGRVAVLDNYRAVELHAKGRRVVKRLPGKGYAEEMKAFVESVRTGLPAIPARSLLLTSLTTFRILDSLSSGRPEAVDLAELLRD